MRQGQDIDVEKLRTVEDKVSLDMLDDREIVAELRAAGLPGIARVIERFAEASRLR